MDIDPQDIDPDTGRPYPGYSSPSLDTTFHDIEMDVNDDDPGPTESQSTAIKAVLRHAKLNEVDMTDAINKLKEAFPNEWAEVCEE